MGAAPAPDFRWLPLRVDAEGKATTEINNVKDLLLEPAMGVEREMAVAVVAGAEVHLCAPVTAKPLTEVSCGTFAFDRSKLQANVCVVRMSNGCADQQYRRTPPAGRMIASESGW